ncbi:MAG: serine/threonine protein kinase [Planctomycetaceae bacterium]|jgi:eukaryotic-like serine/threonine-protein kinase|nr:serine/threonine protein kinase [Planctomycetaceae bacterium]MBT6156942.1 serine/threonine protein kinase [Planctomycetaceae bacterium]MBT6484489.1 serine/threonine protein kinase [Planctomycetaceae bacterium]MBT6498133.1 serine/threonine protein kinase [Planctomycetaceae bacterium]
MAVEPTPSAEPDPTATIYCAGCNERFRVLFVPAACPRCGAEVASDGNMMLAETLLYKVAEGTDAFPTLETPTTNDVGDDLVGRDLHVYRCVSQIGRGGMGRVYLAEHTVLERKCALKILSPRAAARDVDYTSRFMYEAKAAAALVHPNIVTTHAIGEADGFHFLEMEFVAGRSLQQLIQDEGRLTPVRATALSARIAEGLAAAHRARIVHRDLKPDNVLMTHHGIPKIADFGLAKRIHADDDDDGQYLVGTPNFMAPELFRGEQATPASDVYALGVTYFLLLTGQFPYAGGTLQTLMKAVSENPAPNARDLCPDISLEMAECLSLLMAKTPENRPQDAIEAAQLLHAVAGQVRDIESLLSEAFDGTTGVEWTRSEKRYRLRMTLPDGRSQSLFIEPSDHAAVERLILIYSKCCPAQPEYYEEALRLNSEVSHGALALRKIDGEECFVMIDTFPRSTVDPEEIRRSVLEIAFRADAVEKLLTGLDQN